MNDGDDGDDGDGDGDEDDPRPGNQEFQKDIPPDVSNDSLLTNSIAALRACTLPNSAGVRSCISLQILW